MEEEGGARDSRGQGQIQTRFAEGLLQNFDLIFSFKRYRGCFLGAGVAGQISFGKDHFDCKVEDQLKREKAGQFGS